MSVEQTCWRHNRKKLPYDNSAEARKNRNIPKSTNTWSTDTQAIDDYCAVFRWVYMVSLTWQNVRTDAASLYISKVPKMFLGAAMTHDKAYEYAPMSWEAV